MSLLGPVELDCWAGTSLHGAIDCTVEFFATRYSATIPVPEFGGFAAPRSDVAYSATIPLPEFGGTADYLESVRSVATIPIPEFGGLSTPRSDAIYSATIPLPELGGRAGVIVPNQPPKVRIAHRLLLADPIPLPKSSAATDYRTSQDVPWIYGRVTIRLLPADNRGLEWIVAGHPVAAVSRVRIDGVESTGWSLLTIDHRAMLRLSQPAGEVIADVAGAVGRDGALLESAGGIVADLGHRCGLSADPALLRDLRGVPIGIAYHSPLPLRDAVRAIAEPLDAAWGESSGELWGWGRGAAPLSRVSLGVAEIGSITSSARGDMLATGARVAYAREYADGEPGGVLHLSAIGADERIRERVIEIDLGIVRRARDALRIGREALQRAARGQWRVEIKTPRLVLVAGQRVAIDHPLCPVAEGVVIEVSASPWAGGGCSAVIEGFATAAPPVALERRSGYLDAIEGERAGAVLDATTGIATVTIYDDIGRPLSGAQVEIEDGIAATTDANGQIRFPALPGEYLLRVFKAGFDPLEVEVSV